MKVHLLLICMMYDALNRLVKTIDALCNPTLSTYDAVGNLTLLTDAMSNSTNYEYDNLYRLKKELYADGTEKIFGYDDVGNVTSRTDNKSDITQYSYDNNYRLINRNYPDTNDDNFTYDAAGRMLTANNHHGNIAFNYDGANRLLNETLNGKTTGYQYDISNRNRTLSYPSGRTITEVYDQRNRLTALQEGGNDLVNWFYDADNRIEAKAYINGSISTYSYNNNNWTTGINHTNATNFTDLIYTHDKEGNKTSTEFLHKTNHSEKYTYDAKYRLTNFEKGTLVNGNINMPVTQTQYNLDALGNRIDVTKDVLVDSYTTNEMNEYTQIATPYIINPVNDDNGNLIEDGNGKGFGYDYENRLVAIAGEDGTFSITYKYDALGRRIEKSVAGNTTHYYYDGARVIEEQNVSNNTSTTFAYGTWIDDVVNMQRDGQNYFYHQNHLGSVVAVTDANGNIVEQYEYDAYGKVTVYDADFNPQNNSTINNPYLFIGRRFDPESQLYYYRARHYDPNIGRFMQRDPLGYVDGMNLFEYVGGNVVNWVDPSGLKRKCCCNGRSFSPEKMCCIKNIKVPGKDCKIHILVGHRRNAIWSGIAQIAIRKQADRVSCATCKPHSVNQYIKNFNGEKYIEPVKSRTNELVDPLNRKPGTYKFKNGTFYTVPMTDVLKNKGFML